MVDLGKVSRALISVTDKTGVVEFAKTLADEFGVENHLRRAVTAKVLVDAGIPVVPIEEYTGFPEMMEGRVARRCTPRSTAACSRAATPSSTWPRPPSTASA